MVVVVVSGLLSNFNKPAVIKSKCLVKEKEEENRKISARKCIPLIFQILGSLLKVCAFSLQFTREITRNIHLHNCLPPRCWGFGNLRKIALPLSILEHKSCLVVISSFLGRKQQRQPSSVFFLVFPCRQGCRLLLDSRRRRRRRNGYW